MDEYTIEYWAYIPVFKHLGNEMFSISVALQNHAVLSHSVKGNENIFRCYPNSMFYTSDNLYFIQARPRSGMWSHFRCSVHLPEERFIVMLNNDVIMQNSGIILPRDTSGSGLKLLISTTPNSIGKGFLMRDLRIFDTYLDYLNFHRMYLNSKIE